MFRSRKRLVLDQGAESFFNLFPFDNSLKLVLLLLFSVILIESAVTENCRHLEGPIRDNDIVFEIIFGLFAE